MIKLEKKIDEFQSFSQLVALNSDYTLDTIVIKKEVYLSSTFVTRVLELPSKEEILELKRLRVINDIPVSLETSFLRTGLLPNINRYNFEKESLYKTIENNFNTKVSFTNEEILIVRATKDEANQLNIQFGSDLTMIKGISFDQYNNPIEYFESVNIPELYTFQS